MSGVEGIAGLAIGAVGLSALFTTCVDAFNIIITAREFGHEFDVLCADLALQRLRFCLWGETVGFVSRHPDNPTVCLQGLDDPHIQSTLLQGLQAIHLLLKKTDRVQDRFSPQPKSSSSAALGLFRNTFSQFRMQISRGDKRQHSLTAATKWAITSGPRFREDIERLKSLIEGLEKVSKALGVLDIQRSRMRAEIESVEDVESLRLICDASSHSQRDISDTASQRLLIIQTASLADQESTSNTTRSYYSAKESQEDGRAEAHHTDEGYSVSPDDSDVPQNMRILADSVKNISNGRYYAADPKLGVYGKRLRAFNLHEMTGMGKFPSSLGYLRKLLLESADRQSLWCRGSFPQNLPSDKRMARELRGFYAGEVLGIACSPIDSDMSHLLAGIEGSPGSPYEGGVFWIEVRIPTNYPFKPPKMRFLTRVYHPNIDCRGQICLDVLDEQWSPASTITTLLLSICAILNDPTLDDPLVPEIADIYCRDFGLFCENVRTFVARYASAEVIDQEKSVDLPREEDRANSNAVVQETANTPLVSNR